MSAPVFSDRVQETSTTIGLIALVLAGAVSGYQSFASAIPDQAQTYYRVSDSLGNWEVGIGTYTLSGTSLSRDVVLASSNAGVLVNFPAGTKSVVVTFPASAALGSTPNEIPAQKTSTVLQSTDNLMFAHHLTVTGDIILGANSVIMGVG